MTESAYFEQFRGDWSRQLGKSVQITFLDWFCRVPHPIDSVARINLVDGNLYVESCELINANWVGVEVWSTRISRWPQLERMMLPIDTPIRVFWHNSADTS